ncbi:RNA 2',3'-cyclic phosphodiesterase [Draconibacterium sp. IB214405]|uniref:RNA 2',3'-cyclic phosphodiesterase n=1 Tax=Draconibacterium sp. IB214405 TaxID=3097352 RepID=UPI002A0F56DE|nr:RNA 2',3'-cyclic phosphodiesterase [Draconibacterium sp. IB214405]MDX8340864.1 RNA 2',3'-cyclic phosphodiesterase [Draconibacterium sp. IB214405]
MRDHIRTFIAIKIHPNEKVLDLLQYLKKQFPADKINWVDTENFHLTLRFLGNTTREQLYELVDRLEEVVSRKKKCKLSLKGTGYFKSKNQPRVLFVKIQAEEVLELLVQEIEKEVVSCSFEAEQKAYKPHLTLGRIKHVQNTNRFFSLLDEMPSDIYQEIKVDGIILFQSILKTTGPEYRPIKTFALQ